MNKGLYKYLILLLATIISPKSYGQGDSIMQFTLNEAIEYALMNNADAKNARLDIEAAKNKIWVTTAIGLPQISSTVGHQHIPGEIPELDFMGDFFIGFQYWLEPEFPEVMNLEIPPAQPQPIASKNSTTYGATISQLIFSGEYIVGLQAAKTYLQLSENNLEKQTLDIKETVIQSYFSVIILEENQKILKASVQNIESIYSETSEIAKVGLMDPTEVDQLELTLNNTRNALSTARRQTKLSKELFKILLGLGTEDKLELTDSIESISNDLKLEEAPSSKFSLENNIDFKMLETQEELSLLSLKREKSKYLPTIAGFYAYSDKTNKPPLDFTINHIIGVNVEIPIFSSGQRNAKVQQAKIELEKTRNTRQMAEEGLLVQHIQARADYMNALDKYSNEKLNLELSQKILNNTSEKFTEGMVGSMDFTQAQNQYLMTQGNYYTSLMELLNAKIKLEKLLNNL